MVTHTANKNHRYSQKIKSTPPVLVMCRSIPGQGCIGIEQPVIMVQEFRPAVNAGMEGRSAMRKRRVLWNIRLRHPRLLAAGLLAGAVAITMVSGILHPTKEEEKLPAENNSFQSESSSTEKIETVSVDEEMWAVWVPFMSLQTEEKGEKAFQENFDKIVQTSAEKGMNTLIVHVRPFGDALYPSEYFPWSHVVGGTQGVNPGYDPLEYMVEATHKAGMEFHAWVNPLRVQSQKTPSILSEDNPAQKWSKEEGKENWVLKTDSGTYYNPGVEEVRSYIAEGVAEIVRNYEVDGVQFDDYFYPTQDTGFDKSTYEAYCKEAEKGGYASLSQSEWRTANINALVSLVYQKIKAEKPEVVFGISPQGNLSNDKAMGADVATWCAAKGYVDYICPQMYVNFENDALPFTETIATWKSLLLEDSIQFYIGLAVYKAGSDVDDGTWEKSDDIIAKQVMAGRDIDCDGFMFYSYDYLDTEQTQKEMENVMKVLQ